MTFGDRLKAMRTERGITQEDLALLLEVSRNTLIRWEAGSYEPRVSDLVNLSAALDVSLDELVTGRCFAGGAAQAGAC